MRIICCYLCIPPSQHSYAHRIYLVTFYYFTYFGFCATGQAELAAFIRVGFFPLNNFTVDQTMCWFLWEGCAHCEIQGTLRVETQNFRLLKTSWASQGFVTSQQLRLSPPRGFHHSFSSVEQSWGLWEGVFSKEGKQG